MMNTHSQALEHCWRHADAAADAASASSSAPQPLLIRQSLLQPHCPPQVNTPSDRVKWDDATTSEPLRSLIAQPYRLPTDESRVGPRVADVEATKKRRERTPRGDSPLDAPRLLSHRPRFLSAYARRRIQSYRSTLIQSRLSCCRSSLQDFSAVTIALVVRLPVLLDLLSQCPAADSSSLVHQKERVISLSCSFLVESRESVTRPQQSP